MIDTSILDCDVFELADLAFDAYPEPVAFEDFGPYQIGREPIGRGGMGEVFLAHDHAAGRHVAVKFLRAVSPEPDLRTRFDHEIRMLAQLEHPFIARLYDIGIHPSGAPYFVMEYVEGKPLDQFCREHNCSLEQRLRLFRCVCEAVQYAHSRLIVHRDLKPSNILVNADGSPKLLDFGIAKQLENMAEPVTQTQTAVRFTRAYAAPEQIRREQIGVYTDVYALGVVLYELVAGKHPYHLEDRAPGEAELIITGETEPPKPSVSANRIAASRAIWKDLDVLCLKALKKDVHRRYRSVTELIQEIERILKNEPLQARPDSFAYRTRKFLVRNRTAVLAASAAAALIAAVVGFYTWRLANAGNLTLAEAARTRRVEQFLENLFEGEDPDNGPAAELRVLTLLDHGVRQAQAVKGDPMFQAQLYQTLGTIYHSLGNFDRADPLLNSALKIRNTLPGRKGTADVMIALADLRIDQEQLPDAEKLIRAALAIYARVPASTVPMGHAMAALGSVYEERGDYTKAIDTLNQALSLEAGPENLKERTETLTLLGDAYLYTNRYSTADVIFRQTLVNYQQIYGPMHIRVGSAHIDLGHIQANLGNYPEAEKHYRQALVIARSWGGKDSQATVMPESYLAQAVDLQGRYKEGEALLQHALTVVEHAPGDNERRIGFIMGDLAYVALQTGDFKKAEADNKREVEIFRTIYGPRHQFTAKALRNLGTVYTAEGRYPDAENVLRQALDIYTQALPSGALNIGIAQVELGRVLLREKRYHEAEPYSLAGYEVIKQQAKPSLDYLRSARADLIEIYSALNQPGKAAQFQEPLTSAAARR